MAKKKDRFFDDVKLHNQLYTDQRGRVGHWRIKLPSGKYKAFAAETAEEANKVAEWAIENAASIEDALPEFNKENQILVYVNEFIKAKESEQPALKTKQSWHAQRKPMLIGFAKHFHDTALHDLTFKDHMRPWWQAFTYHAQKKRAPIFKEFFNELLADDMLPAMQFNPFSENTGKPYLKSKPVPKKKRQRMTIATFWAIYDEADNQGDAFLQIAMTIALLTTMRRGDICELEFDKHIKNDSLEKIISKSAEQKGTFNAACLKWDLKKHTELRNALNRARVVSLKNGRCPYVLSFKPKRSIVGNVRTHRFQVLPNFLTKRFREIRNDLVKSGKLDKIAGNTTFHEIRSLSSYLFSCSGINTGDIQELMAHTDESMTQHYMSGHEQRWTDIKIELDSSILKRKF